MSPALRATLTAAMVLTLAGCGGHAVDPAVAKAGEAFLATNAKAPGVHVTATGLQYRILTSGPASGSPPKATDEVKVNYEGKLLDGTVFDSSYQRGAPAVFGLDHVIPAWTEALQLMHPGDIWEIYAPANLAYGDDGAGGSIPPGAVLDFKIELIAVNRGG